MELHVKCTIGNLEDGFEAEVESFEEIDKIGARVGSVVRRWLRYQVPLRGSGARTTIQLDATWRDGAKAEHAAPADSVEDQRPKPRRKKRAK